MDTQMSDKYSLDLVVPVDMIGDIVKLIDKRGVLVRVTPANGIGLNGTKRRPYVPPKPKADAREARDVVFSALRQQEGETPRKVITKALVAKGYSARSVGPICTLLQRDGVIFSPRRGFWQVKE